MNGLWSLTFWHALWGFLDFYMLFI
jgi:hypothetical protein